MKRPTTDKVFTKIIDGCIIKKMERQTPQNISEATPPSEMTYEDRFNQDLAALTERIQTGDERERNLASTELSHKFTTLQWQPELAAPSDEGDMVLNGQGMEYARRLTETALNNGETAAARMQFAVLMADLNGAIPDQNFRQQTSQQFEQRYKNGWGHRLFRKFATLASPFLNRTGSNSQ